MWPFLLRYPVDKIAIVDQAGAGPWVVGVLCAAPAAPCHTPPTCWHIQAATLACVCWPAPLQVCVYHPPSLPQKGPGLYAAEAPYRQKEEESRRFAEYGGCASDPSSGVHRARFLVHAR